MNSKNYLFTSESVSEGHPDKVCDRISDMVVDTYISKDPFARVACETLTTTNKVILAGEVRGPETSKEHMISKVREGIKDIGYEQKGFHWKNCNIDVHLHSQSSDNNFFGIDFSRYGLTISFTFFWSTFDECCVEITMDFTLIGFPFS